MESNLILIKPNCLWRHDPARTDPTNWSNKPSPSPGRDAHTHTHTKQPNTPTQTHTHTHNHTVTHTSVCRGARAYLWHQAVRRLIPHSIPVYPMPQRPLSLSQPGSVAG